MGAFLSEDTPSCEGLIPNNGTRFPRSSSISSLSGAGVAFLLSLLLCGDGNFIFDSVFGFAVFKDDDFRSGAGLITFVFSITVVEATVLSISGV